RAENITDQDLIVYTAAIKEDNPERVRAKELGIPQIERAGMLGLLMKNYASPICISGTHGKTTTTGLVAQTFLECGCDPTVSVGGNLDAIGGNIRIGGKEYFIAEACEYHSSFLSFFPKVSVILNIEADHLDYFRDLDHIIETFHKLTELTPADGCVIANVDDKNVLKALEGTDCRIVTFGIESDADFTAKNILHDGNDFYSYDLYKDGEKLFTVKLSVPGRHNIYNSLAAAAVAEEFGLDREKTAAAFSRYGGTHRRFERKGKLNGAVIVDDYAHHPTEINATLTAASEMAYKNVYVVFQPHTYSRTYTLYNDFVKVLSRKEIKLILADIYAARETDTGLVSSKGLAADIEGAIYLPSFGEIEDYLRKNAGSGDLIITMGAGDVYKIGENLLKK
ncbi:MAG: UDP-N-acetylmuramate--L-alanine ligase, partial [Clostridia bacterium]